jgi:hypothetical protein
MTEKENSAQSRAYPDAFGDTPEVDQSQPVGIIGTRPGHEDRRKHVTRAALPEPGHYPLREAP